MSEQNPLIPPTPPVYAFMVVDLDQVESNEHLIGDDPDKAFIDSIRDWGIIQPVGLIQPAWVTGDQLDTPYQVAYGRKRVKAARACGRTSIPSFVYSPGMTVADVLALIENEQRKKNPVSDLISIENLLSAGASEANIAQAIGCSISTLHVKMRLLRLIPELREALRLGQLRASAATEAARLDEEKQLKLLDTLREQDTIRVKDIRAVRQAAQQAVRDSLPEMLFETPYVDEAAGGFEGEREQSSTLVEAFEKVIDWMQRAEHPFGVVTYLVHQYDLLQLEASAKS